MSDCDCGAHYLQNCSWWCGMTDTEIKLHQSANSSNKRLEDKIDELAKDVKKLSSELEKYFEKREGMDYVREYFKEKEGK